MAQADDIRKFVLEKWILQARNAKQAEVIVRASDVHNAMHLENAFPAVCSAIGSTKFTKLAKVTLIDRTGPANSSSVIWKFALGGLEKIDRHALERLKDKFLRRYNDFERLTFAASSGGYWEEERRYKQGMIEQARAAVTTDPMFLAENIDGVNLRAALAGLNARIEYLFDRDHQIGHAYFLGCSRFEQIEGVMRCRVIPLLVEYFYENWEKVRFALNEKSDNGGFIVREILTGSEEAGEGLEFDRERWRYSIRASFSKEAFNQLER